ncbi:energy transducer TonB [Roseitranquillus sediminis]|uniref:energy transducer TonB n=1 Tax=Roseitranquillus sediminis TaxID=2809051 RepID=UPI001D0CC7A1|nr:TonB family protein [Roseitranquillus sediminis]MBM9594398.1 TonB family protein [Roseitranquillus sediminis]
MTRTAEAAPPSHVTKRAAREPATGEATAAAPAGLEDYKKLVLVRIARQPRRATGLRGSAVIGLRIAGNGRVAELNVQRSSGSPRLDAVAVAHVRRAAPFPPPPDGISVTVVVTVESVG